MKTHTYFFTSLIFLLLGFFFLTTTWQRTQESLASELSPKILRFHILANSDLDQDQLIKLEVRNLILDYVQTQLPDATNKEEIVTYLTTHKSDLDALASSYLSENGFSYDANLEFTNCYFPPKVYNDLVMPAGYYDAIRMVLGNGNGKNWWCVLYPTLCFSDFTCSEIPKESLELLHSAIENGDDSLLEDHRLDLNIAFYFFPNFSL